MCDGCIYLVYEKDTGASWCKVGGDMDNCAMGITRQDVEDYKAEEKYNDLADRGLI